MQPTKSLGVCEYMWEGAYHLRIRFVYWLYVDICDHDVENGLASSNQNKLEINDIRLHCIAISREENFKQEKNLVLIKCADKQEKRRNHENRHHISQ